MTPHIEVRTGFRRESAAGISDCQWLFYKAHLPFQRITAKGKAYYPDRSVLETPAADPVDRYAEHSTRIVLIQLRL